MKAMFGELIVIALALMLIAGAVFGLRDSTVFVSPPEAVAEGFVRQLVASRYEEALPYLSRELKLKVSAEALKQLTVAMKSRAGRILDVKGEPVSIDGDRAEAAVQLKCESGRTPRVKLSFAREEGEWAINGLGNLESGAIE